MLHLCNNSLDFRYLGAQYKLIVKYQNSGSLSHILEMGTAIKGPCFIFEFILDRDPSKLPTKAKNSIKNGMSAVILEIYGIKPRTSGAATGNKFVVVTDPLGVLPTSSDLSAFQPSVEEKLGKLAKLVEIRVGEMNDKSVVFKTAGYKINTSITQLPLPLLGSLPAPNKKPHSSTKPSETVTKVPQTPVVPLSLPAPQIHSAKEPLVTNNPVEPVIQNNQPQISATPNPSEPAVPAKVKQIPPIENPQPVPVNNPPAPERPNLPVELKLNFDPTAWSGDADEKTLLTSLKRIWPATGLGKPADADVLKRSQGIYIVRFVPTVPNGDPQTVSLHDRCMNDMNVGSQYFCDSVSSRSRQQSLEQVDVCILSRHHVIWTSA